MWKRIIGAIEDSDPQLVSFYLKQGPELVYEQNYQNETLLHFAAQNGNPYIISELLRLGANTNTPDEFGWTPLHEACNNGNEQAATMFIEAGTDLAYKTKKMETPLHLATRHSFLGIMARLLDAGVNRNPTNKLGNTPLHIAAQQGLVKSVELLLTAGANPLAKNLEGCSPLHLAAWRGHTECAQLLLENNAAPEQVDNRRRNFLEIASIFRQHDFIQHFKTKFADEDKNDEQVTANPSAEKSTKKALSQDKSRLKTYFNKDKPKSQCATSATKIFRGLLLGEGSGNNLRGALRTIESILWFFVFPVMLFILWQGFASNILPPLVSLNLTGASIANTVTLQNTLNVIIVIIFSYLLVATEKQMISYLHFFKDLRESVVFRILHLAIIEAQFYHKLVYNQEFVRTFITFWMCYMALYTISYLAWWTDVHMIESTETTDECLFLSQ